MLTNQNKKEKGGLGEGIASQYLKDCGYQILERNFKSKRSEIDIIAKQNDCLVFVEVRAKSNSHFGFPEETINKKKINKIKRGVSDYLNFKKGKENFRIDAICLIFDKNNQLRALNHYQDITNN